MYSSLAIVYLEWCLVSKEEEQTVIITAPAHGSSQCFFQIPQIVLSCKTSLAPCALRSVPVLSSFWSQDLSTFVLGTGP